MDIGKLYRNRFHKNDLDIKNKVWEILCEKFFQKYISYDSVVLDIGAGYCEFINNIKARKKYAIDINNDIYKYADSSVKIFILDAKRMKDISSNSIDFVFISNFFEHLDIKKEILVVLKEIHRVLKKGGKVLILQPNIRYCYKEYWDFFDHKLPLTHKSLEEALLMQDFKIYKSIPRFLPYTIKSNLPKNSFIIKLYLKLPFIWKLFGKQAFIIGTK